MNIKTFRADSLREGLRRVHEEFGRDARILHAREVDESRLFGLRRRHFVEITAAEVPAPLESPPASEASDPVPSAGDALLRQLERSPYETTTTGKPVSGATSFSTPVSPGKDRSEADAEPTWSPVPQGLWYRMTPRDLNPTVLQQNLIAKLEALVRFGGPLDLPGNGRTLVALTGPAGVGKTTTVAKLAAHYRLKELKRVGIVTFDVQRIAAAEQVRQYAEILDVPVEVVSEPHRVKTALGRLRDRELILLDTPGTNPKDVEKFRGVAALLDAATVDETLLLLPATSTAAVLFDALRRFEPLAPTALALTKLDEATGMADLYRFLKENTLPLRFFATGQNVSEDLEVAGPVRLASLV